jgi:transposase
MLGARPRFFHPARGSFMPPPTPTPLRQVIWQRARRGLTANAIAHDLGLQPRTVRHLLQRFEEQGRQAIAPSYDACGRPRTTTNDTLREEALGLRRQHPTWGAGLIRVFLRRHHPRANLPSERTLQRWLEQEGLGPAPQGRRPATEDPARATQPHTTWQMDASERIPLQSGRRICWLRLVDECSGAPLATRVFPPGLLGGGSPHGRAKRAAPRLPALGAAVGPPGG